MWYISHELWRLQLLLNISVWWIFKPQKLLKSFASGRVCFIAVPLGILRSKGNQVDSRFLQTRKTPCRSENNPFWWDFSGVTELKVHWIIARILCFSIEPITLVIQDKESVNFWDQTSPSWPLVSMTHCWYYLPSQSEYQLVGLYKGNWFWIRLVGCLQMPWNTEVIPRKFSKREVDLM